MAYLAPDKIKDPCTELELPFMVKTASTDGAADILARIADSIDAAVGTAAALAASITQMAENNTVYLLIFIYNITDKKQYGSLEESLHLIGRHEHIARLGTLCRADDTHLLHLVHKASGLVEAYLELALHHRN